jgi:hypothetical protein
VRAEGGAAEGETERRKMTDRGILGAGGGRADAKQNDVPFFILNSFFLVAEKILHNSLLRSQCIFYFDCTGSLAYTIGLMLYYIIFYFVCSNARTFS